MADDSGRQLGRRIKRRAAEVGVKASLIAEACGVTPAAVYGWYHTGRIHKKHLLKLAQILRWTIRDILGESANLPAPIDVLSLRAHYLGKLFDKLPEEEQQEVWAAMLKLLGHQPDGDGSNPPARPKSRTPKRAH